MTTNGYLLTEDIVRELEKLNFKYIQITIDGPKDIHDNRRMLVSGKGTFDKIIENIKLFKDSSVVVSVRINIDKENAAMYSELSKLIDSLDMDNVRIYPALVEFTPNQESCRECKCMTATEFSEFASTDAREYYFDNGGFNCGNISVNCGAEHLYSYVIDDYGDVYKCWNSVGYENDKLFILNNNNEIAGVNEKGEICVRGTSLAMGYYNDKENTEKSFVQNPLNSTYPELIYRTGDIGLVDEKGLIMFKGRRDSLIKHLGYRIELNEIEHIIINVLQIVDNGCAVYNCSKKQIVFVYEAECDISPMLFRNKLSQKLPKYMIPTIYIKMNALPTNTNGKLDRLSINGLVNKDK